MLGRGFGSLAEELLDLLGVRLGHLDVVRDGTHLLARLVLEQVSTAGLLAHDLASAGQAETLLRTAVRLHLRHGADLLRVACASGRTWSVGPGCPPEAHA